MRVADLKRSLPDVAQVARDLFGINFKRGIARCPFSSNHTNGDENPSLRYDAQKNRIFCASQNCFGEKGVDAIELVRTVGAFSFPAAIEKLSDFYAAGYRDAGTFAAPPRQESGARRREPRRILAEAAREKLRAEGLLFVAEYSYGPNIRKVRFANPNQTQPGKKRSSKTFRWEHCVDGVWYSGDGGNQKPLYVNSVFAEASHVQVALGLEGEAKADASGTFGIPAFSFKDITPEQAAILADREVVLWPDKDPSGAKQAEAAARVIRSGRPRRIAMLTPPAELSDGGDIMDAISDLGWDRQRVMEAISSALPFSDVLEHEQVSSDAAFHSGTEETGSGRPMSFQISPDGVFFQKLRDDGSFEPVRLSARVEIVAETRDSNGVNWGRLLQWKDNEDREHQWAMPMQLLASDAAQVRAHLLSEGLPNITTNARLRERFNEYLQTGQSQNRLYCVSRVGWHNGVYVLPEKVFGSTDSTGVLYQGGEEEANRRRTSGTLEDWRELVGKMCAGNSRLTLVVSCALAGPLLSIAKTESGGIHFHGASSTGKSTALLVGGSVWDGKRGSVPNWRVTTNGLEAVAHNHNDGTLFLDEIAQLDPLQASETAYLLANGSGKSRMNRTMTARKPLSWTLLFVSAGEVTLAEHAASAGKRLKAGAALRLLNVPADAGKGMGIFEDLHGAASASSFVQQLREAASQVYGTPIAAFLSRLVQDIPAAKEMIRMQREALAKAVPATADGQVQRAAERFGLIAAAGELATEWGITGWAGGEATYGAERCFRDWLQNRGTVGDADVEEGVMRVRDFIAAHGASRFQNFKRDGSKDAPLADSQIVAQRAGFRRENRKGETDYLLFPATFQGICAGLDYRAVAQELARRGCLEREGKNLTIKPRLPGLGPSRVYSVNASILGNEDVS